MTKHRWLLIVGLFAATGCGEVVIPDVKSCETSCTTTADCPSGFTCGGLGLCAAEGETCSCTAGEFVSCDNGSALYCNAEASGIRNEACGAPGCNTTAKRCNTCVVDTTSCSADSATLDYCGSEGVVAQSETCAAGCVADAAGARCAHIKPAFLPDVCNEPATMPQAVFGSLTLNVQDDTSCTGGVIQVNGTTFCVVRAATIDITDLKVTGTRAIAFVADDSLTVSGTLDVSADGPTPGPGAGTRGAGTATINASYLGGGGSGFAQTGGAGGGGDTGGLGKAGGPITSRLTTDPFVGGATAPPSQCSDGVFGCISAVDFPGGGGGGGAVLIACRGAISVSSTAIIDAGGGGGTGGGDHYTGTANVQGGAPGGGSGGYVVFQGMRVSIMGKLYANGGGGGAGCSGDNCRGLVGTDGLRASSGAPGGDPAGNTCGGGVGGSLSNAPGNGEQTFSNAAAGAGGGGGSVGRFEVFIRSGVTPVLTPTEASPAPTTSSTALAVE